MFMDSGRSHLLVCYMDRRRPFNRMLYGLVHCSVWIRSIMFIDLYGYWPVWIRSITCVLNGRDNWPIWIRPIIGLLYGWHHLIVCYMYGWGHWPIWMRPIILSVIRVDHGWDHCPTFSASQQIELIRFMVFLAPISLPYIDFRGNNGK